MPDANEVQDLTNPPTIQRLRQVFQFLQELNQLRNPPKRKIEDQKWHLSLADLPNHPAIELGRRTVATALEEHHETESADLPVDDDFVLRVRRPDHTLCPSPTEAIRDWVSQGWDDLKLEKAEFLQSRNDVDEDGETVIVRFEDDPMRPAAFEEWQELRGEWRRNEIPARKAYHVYEKLYDLRSTLQRESEKCDLVLGDGLLSCSDPGGSVFHPVLLQRVELEFDPSVPQFKIIDADADGELNTALLSSIEVVNSSDVAELLKELASQALHPLMDEASAFLKSLASRLFTAGELIPHEAPPHDSEPPRIGRSLSLFLRERRQGYRSAITNVLNSIENRKDFCSALFNIVGEEPPLLPAPHVQPGPAAPLVVDDDDILFGKHTNAQQVEIARHLGRSDCVLVQGPPGTGKTHTIANLIGHVLAQGKSVLVTSHTTKALRVLRQHLAEELRPLCVSHLDDGAASREQLKESVQGITQRLSNESRGDLETEAMRLADRRKQLQQQLKELNQKMKSARSAEYRDIVVGGQAMSPADVARFIRERKDDCSWIPGPLAAGTPLPLSVDEVRELYATNSGCSTSDTTHINAALPEVPQILSPALFKDAVEQVSAGDATPFDRSYWYIQQVGRNTFGDLNSIAASAASVSSEFNSLERWQQAAVDAGRRVDGLKTAWERLIAEIEETNRLAAESSLLRIEHPVELNDDDIDAQQQLASEIAERFKVGKRSLPWNPTKRKSWQQAIASWRVSGEEPSKPEHFEAIAAAAALRNQRDILKVRWKRLLEEHNGPDIDSFGEAPWETCSQYIAQMRDALTWWQNKVSSLQRKLEGLSFDWTVFLQAQPPVPGLHGEILRILRALEEPLRTEVEGITVYLRAVFAKRKLKKLEDTLSGFQHPAVSRLVEASKNRRSTEYTHAFAELEAAIAARPVAKKREELLAKLEANAKTGEPVAGNWAAEVRDRVGQHGGATPPGDPREAWQWRQLLEELERRASVDSVALAQEAEGVTADLLEVTNRLIDRKAWAEQHNRVGRLQRLALNGWLDTIDRFGKGGGVRAAQLLAEARKQLKVARSAVPVWVMPMSQVVEKFGFDSAPFDVVVIDEASQCDVTGLLAFTLGKSVIVVGDEEQVSPSAVGQNQQDVQGLIETHLNGIPNAANYDGRQSVFRVARTAFEMSTCLLEHFRCVPDIIRFSNSLSYANRMKPLREQGSSSLTPAVVAHRVESGSRDGDVNRAEALVVASLVAAAIESDEYVGQSFGVICMLGNEQAIEIETQLRKRVSPSLMEERRVVCGNAAQFQGDERDVMFLSLVYSSRPDGGPLPLHNAQEYKQRFNVAASRARNQMWVVHSLNPNTDLKNDDLRRRLIEHAQDPTALATQIEAAQARAGSPFENQVIERLMNRRFRVTPQWPVGAYSIDIVVEGGGKRLAVECDGDRYHPIEQIPQDMARQAVLERLGWTFHRIRGSEFFRDPDAAMERLFQRLEKMEIPPELQLSPSADEPRRNNSIEETSADKVIRRAAELRSQWQNSEQDSAETLLPGPCPAPDQNEESKAEEGLLFDLDEIDNDSDQSEPTFAESESIQVDDPVNERGAAADSGTPDTDADRAETPSETEQL